VSAVFCPLSSTFVEARLGYPSAPWTRASPSSRRSPAWRSALRRSSWRSWYALPAAPTTHGHPPLTASRLVPALEVCGPQFLALISATSGIFHYNLPLFVLAYFILSSEKQRTDLISKPWVVVRSRQ